MKGFLCEEYAVAGAQEITSLGSWRKFRRWELTFSLAVVPVGFRLGGTSQETPHRLVRRLVFVKNRVDLVGNGSLNPIF